MNAYILGGAAVLGATCLAVSCTQTYDDFAFTGATTATGTTASGTPTGTTPTAGTGGGGATGGSGQGGTGTATVVGGQGGTGTGSGGSGQGGSGQGGTGTGTTGASVLCDTTPCDVSSGGYCCLPTGMGSPSCEASGNGCGFGYTDVYCDGPEDCPGQECCGSFAGSSYVELTCVNSCTGFGAVLVCDPQGPDICDAGDSCLGSQFLPTGYFVCR